MRRLLGAVNPRALDANALAHVMQAFASLDGAWCDVAIGDASLDLPVLFYFDGQDDEVES